MSKLYSRQESPQTVRHLSEVAEEHYDLDKDLSGLDNTVNAYCSMGNITDVIAAESHLFVTPGNTALYNEYVKLLAQRFDIVPPKLVDPFSFESESVIAVNYAISLEGWMGTIWEKIKGFFTSIANSVKKFFTTYFTSLGRVKNALQNLDKLLKSTTKELQPTDLESVPSALERHMTGFKDVSAVTVGSAVGNCDILLTAFASISADARGLAKDKIVSPDFIANIKKLKDTALSASDSVIDNQAKRNGPLGVVGANNRAITATNDSLNQVRKKAQDKANADDAKADEMGSGDKGSEEANTSEGAAAYRVFVDKTKGALAPVVGKPLASGKSIKEVKVTEDNKLEIETETSEDKPELITLGNRASLIKLVTSAIALIKKAEDNVKVYIDVNEAVAKGVTSIDKLIADIDKIDPEKYGKYKNVINQQVREQLRLLQQFFTNYNKIGKNAFDLSVQSAQCVVVYAGVSLKYYN